MKKMDNKGFSLVELIVVVAIMAVLMTVLAPQYLKYVEKSRLQKDNSAIAEIANAIKISMADEDINNAVTSGTTITITNATGDAGAVGVGAKTIAFDTGKTGDAYDNPLEAELASVTVPEFTTSSNTYRDSTTPIEITITITDGVIKISATGWIESVGDAPTNDTNAKVF